MNRTWTYTELKPLKETLISPIVIEKGCASKCQVKEKLPKSKKIGLQVD